MFLADPHNHAELATILQAIIRDPLASQQIGQRGYDDIGREQERLMTAGQGWPLLFKRLHEEIQQRRHLMSLAEMQSYLAQLYTDDSFRKLFTIAPEASFENYLLTEQEKQALLAIDQRLLEYFATSLKMKQQEYLRTVYRATFALPQELVQRVFQRFYQWYPAKPHEDLFTRLLDFGVFLEQVFAQDEQAPCYASEVARYERLHYLYTYQARSEDALTAINTKETKAVPLSLDTALALLPGVHRETFVYPIVSIVEALSAQQAPEERSIQPGRCELVFQREAHSLTLNVFEINQETSLLLDLCQQTYTIGAIIEAVERQLQETSLADDILGMLGALQEQQIIGGVHGQ